MTQTVQIQNNFSFGGISFNASVTLTADIVMSTISSVQAAQAGTLTTRTDNNTGTLTMTSGSHGITTGALLDIYWTGGTRRHMTVGTVSGTSVPIDLGAGDNLPIATTAIIACVPVRREIGFTNASLVLIAVQASVASQFSFYESDTTTEDYYVHIVPANTGQQTSSYWYNGLSTLPLTGTAVEYVYLSHNDTTQAQILQVGILTN